jgi:hypothetical protein
MGEDGRRGATANSQPGVALSAYGGDVIGWPRVAGMSTWRTGRVSGRRFDAGGPMAHGPAGGRLPRHPVRWRVSAQCAARRTSSCALARTPGASVL